MKLRDSIVTRNLTQGDAACAYVTCCLWAGLLLTWTAAIAPAADQPQWGQRDSRNMVSEEKGLPDSFDPGTRNQKTGEIESARRRQRQMGRPAGRSVLRLAGGGRRPGACGHEQRRPPRPAHPRRPRRADVLRRTDAASSSGNWRCPSWTRSSGPTGTTSA